MLLIFFLKYMNGRNDGMQRCLDTYLDSPGSMLMLLIELCF